MLVQEEIKAVYLGDTKIRPTKPPFVIDYVTQATGGSYSSFSYYYGLAFTPNKNCTLDKVIFLGNTSGTLKIAQGYYASSNTGVTTYSISSATTEYELPTPYQLTANTIYTVSVYGTGYYNTSVTMPISGENVTFNHGTYSNRNTAYTSYVYVVQGLQTTAT